VWLSTKNFLDRGDPGRDEVGWEGVRLQDGFGIADASEFDPCASFAMNGRFVT
jgi:hypothetical protein